MNRLRGLFKVSRRRGALAAIGVGVVAAALIGAVPAVPGLSGSGQISPSFITRGELATLHDNHPKTPSKLVPKLDRLRAARCANLAYQRTHAAHCPTVWRGPTAVISAHRALPSKTATRAKTEAALAPADQIGRWTPPFDIPQLTVHMIALPTGKVLMYAYPDSTHVLNEATAWLWDPTTGATKEVDPPINPTTGEPYNIWCSGATLLANGDVLVAGGNLEYAATPTSVGWKGLNVLLTFNPFTETWTKQPNMRHGRWYPTVTRLPDGRAIITSGYDEGGANAINQDLEVFTPSADPSGVGTLELKPSASRVIDLYPHQYVLPNGKVLMAGPGADAALLDTTTWTWTNVPAPPTVRGWGSAVLLPSGPAGPQTLMMFGGVDQATTVTATASTIKLNLNNISAGWTAGPPMNYARAHLNSVILPDDNILQVGGGAGQDPVDGNLYIGPVYQSEIYNPNTNAFTLADTQAEERTYHSTAVLLPDGRVFSAGDDRPGHQFTDKGELYSPPYLFKGARPQINFAPGAVRYNAPFRIAVDNPSAITSVKLIALGADTHANDMNQRSVALNMTTQADGLTLTSPANANIAPPGYYMLFALNAQGVPSVSKMIKLDPAAPDAPPLPGGNQPPTAAFTVSPTNIAPGQTVTFTDASSDPDGTITARAWDTNGDGVFDNGTGATTTATFPTAGSYQVSLRVTDNGGLSTTTTSTVFVTADPAAGIPVPAGNLTINPGFEANLNGWGGWQADIDRVPLADAPNGGYVVKSTRTSGNYFSLDDGPDTVPSATAGRTYTGTAYVKAASASSVGKPVHIAVRERTAAGAFVNEAASPTVGLTNAFQPITATYTATATGNVVDVYVQEDTAVAGDAMYTDLVSLVPGTGGGGGGGGTTPIPTGNLTSNPSVETNAAGWGAWQSAVTRVAQADAPNGGFALQVAQTTGTYYSVDDTPDTVASATAGTTYTGTAYVKAGNAASVGKPIHIAVRERTAAGAFVAESASTPIVLTNAFQPITAAATAQATGDVIDVYVQQDTAVAGNAFYADLISLVPTAGGGGGGGGGTTPIPTGNLTSNPSVETNAAGWGAWQSAVTRVAQADAPNGGFALQVAQTTGTYYSLDDTPDTVASATAGTTYTGTAYVKAGNAASVGKPIHIAVRERTAAGAFVNEAVSPATTLTNTFQPVTAAYTATATGNIVDVYVQQDTAVAGNAFYADLISLVPTAGGGGGGGGTTPIPTGNLTSNPSVETNAAGWGAWQSAVTRVAQADAPNGGFALQVAQTTGTYYSLDDTPDTVASATAGTTYTGTAYVKAGNAASVGKPIHIAVRERTAAGAFVNEAVSPATTLTNTFQPVTAAYTATATGNIVDVYVQQDTAVAGNAFYADLISLVPSAGGGGGTTPIPTGNLTVNPSFETNAANWAGLTATVARTATTGSPNGNFAALVTRSSGTTFGLEDSPDTVNPAVAGATYQGSAYVKSSATGSTGKVVTLTVQERTTAGTVTKTATATVTLTAAFQKVTVNLTTTTGVTGRTVDVRLTQAGAAAGHAFSADLISLVRTV